MIEIQKSPLLQYGPAPQNTFPPHLACVVVDDEAGVPAVEVLVGTHFALQFLEQRAVRPISLGMHGGTDIVQDTHDPGGVLWTQQLLRRAGQLLNQGSLDFTPRRTI